MCTRGTGEQGQGGSTLYVMSPPTSFQEDFMYCPRCGRRIELTVCPCVMGAQADQPIRPSPVDEAYLSRREPMISGPDYSQFDRCGDCGQLLSVCSCLPMETIGKSAGLEPHEDEKRLIWSRAMVEAADQLAGKRPCPPN